MRRRGVLRALRAAALGGPLLWMAVARAADTVARLIEALGSARSFKVRIHAANLLARLEDPRRLGALMQSAAQDPHPAVRGIVVRLLARVARRDPEAARRARPAIARGLADREPFVRRQASAALSDLDRGLVPAPPRSAPRPAVTGTVVAVGAIGDRTGKAPRAIRERMRALMQSLLEREPRVRLAAMTAPGVAFLVDGTIARLQVGLNAQDLEAVCAVELVISRPPRGIVTVASGEAIVQHPRTRYHPVLAAQMQEEALDNAVKSAHDSLAQFLRAQ
jgi:HEAT repeats